MAELFWLVLAVLLGGTALVVYCALRLAAFAEARIARPERGHAPLRRVRRRGYSSSRTARPLSADR